MMNKFLAEYLKVNKGNITRYRNGETTPPIDKLIKMCELFKVNLTDFVLHDLTDDNTIHGLVEEPGANYINSLEVEIKMLHNRINELELALFRHVKDPEVLRRYIKDA
jgi:transcriptional regulator with XRE-family HTH domain